MSYALIESVLYSENGKPTYILNHSIWMEIARAKDFGTLIVKTRKNKIGKKNRLGKCKKLNNTEKMWLSDLYKLPLNKENILGCFSGLESKYEGNEYLEFAIGIPYVNGYLWKKGNTLTWGDRRAECYTIGDMLYELYPYGYALMWNIDIMRYYFRDLIPSEVIRNPENHVIIGAKDSKVNENDQEDDFLDIFEDEVEDAIVEGYTAEDYDRLNRLLPFNSF